VTRDAFGLRIDQKIFFFDPEPEIFRHHRPLHCRSSPRNRRHVALAKLLKKRG
jgi:hypothetical protein